MTVEEILNAALAICGESSPFPVVRGFAVSWANALLAEIFPADRSIAEANGTPVPENIGTVSALGDVLPCAEELCRGALVNGFAAFICDIGEDRALAAEFRTRFYSAIHTAAKANEHAVSDYY